VAREGTRSLSLVTGSGSGIQHRPLQEELSSESSRSRQPIGGSTPVLSSTSAPPPTQESLSYSGQDNNHPAYNHSQTVGEFEFVNFKKSSSAADTNSSSSHSTMAEPQGDISNDSNDSSRFRVNRIYSSQLHNPPVSSGSHISSVIPEDRPLELSDNHSSDPPPNYPNMHMQPRRSSLAQGLGGGRKKSVSLPREADYLETSDRTVYGKNFAYYTREALPNMDNYKNIIDGVVQRPTLDELRSEAMYAKVELNENPNYSKYFRSYHSIIVQYMTSSLT